MLIQTLSVESIKDHKAIVMVYTEDRKPLKAADWVIIAIYFVACILVGLWVRICVTVCCLALFDTS